MSKAILVIDMPKTCDDCKYCQNGRWLNYLCGLTYEEFEFFNGERKKFCPLKPMPTHVIDRNTFAIENKHMNYQDGYNACIDEITGGEENEQSNNNNGS